jgi:hypothetical protein
MKLPFGRRRESLFASHETFFRGLTLGALIGAAIAGSTLWSRIRGRRRDESSAIAP